MSKNKLHILENRDKKFHEKIDPTNPYGNIPHPHRACFVSPPGSQGRGGGKTMMILNLLIHQEPPFDKIYMLHCDPEFTKEYDDLDDVILLDEIPSLNEFDASLKNLLIIEDICYKKLSKDEQHSLDRILGNGSTHRSISCYMTAQDAFQIPVNFRRLLSMVFLWNSFDKNALSMLSSRFGIKKDLLEYIFDNHLTGPHDSLCLDMGSDEPYRKNLLEPLDIKEIKRNKKKEEEREKPKRSRRSGQGPLKIRTRKIRTCKQWVDCE